MNDEEIDVLYNEILKLPKVERPITATTMCEINVNTLFDTIRAFRKIPEYNELIKDNHKKQQEIERLNKENKILRENAEHNDKVVDKVNWENKRLSNIISELEKEIKWQRKICLSLNNYGVSVCDILLNKLQELKGSDKE